MKNWKGSTGVKFVLSLAFLLACVVGTLSGMLTVFTFGVENAWEHNKQVNTKQELISCIAEQAMYEGDMRTVEEGYYSVWQSAQESESAAEKNIYDWTLAEYAKQFDPSNTNFRFAILDGSGETVLGTYTEGETVIAWGAQSIYEDTSESDSVETEYRLYGYVADPEVTGVQDDYARMTEIAAQLYDMRNQGMPLLVGSGVCALVLLVLLMIAAGHRKDTEQLQTRLIDRIPWDLALVLWTCAVALCVGGVAAAIEFYMGYSNSIGEMLIRLVYGNGMLAFGALGAGCGLVLLTFMMSLAARVKQPGWLKNALCIRFVLWVIHGVRKGAGAVTEKVGETVERAKGQKENEETSGEKHNLLRRIWNGLVQGLRRFFRWIGRGFRVLGRGLAGLPIIGKGVLITLLFVGGDWVCVGFWWNGGGFLLAVWTFAQALALLYAFSVMKRLQIAAKTIADGDLDYRVDTKRMLWDFKAHGEALNHIGEGLSLAVDDRMKSERMKTELITNVSHDLKTPLTSIVNYVDLLKKEELTGAAADYVDVLDRQSARLKKLTEDLVEASKASTGNLPVSLETVELGEFLEQVQAEYAARLQKATLEIVAEPAPEHLTARADGRYLWRILDNLLGNVCKYALPGTRVYLAAEEREGYSVISVKNISREKLNISAEELMERFVRGDDARNTEGSGLGLSIARSLAALMDGELKLTIDGDLFKAEVWLHPGEKTE